MQEKTSLLIVDDDEDMLETMKDCFQEKGYRIEIAKTGKDAITNARKHFFDVALIDIKLPDISGLDVLRTFRENHPKIMNIVITANATIQNAADAVNLGAHAYIMKPIDMEKLHNIINENLRTQQIDVSRCEVPASLRKPEVRSILQMIKEGGVTEFKPLLSYEKGIFYPEIERINPNPSMQYSILVEFEKYGIVKRTLCDSILTCPSCGSHKLFGNFRCTSCQSTNITRTSAVNFKCDACSNVMPMPRQVYICGDCDKILNENQVNIKKKVTFKVVSGRVCKALIEKWIIDFDDILESAREFYRRTQQISPKVKYQNPDSW